MQPPPPPLLLPPGNVQALGEPLPNGHDKPAHEVPLAKNLPEQLSTMNVGGELRARHLSLVLSALNTMVAGTVLSM